VRDERRQVRDERRQVRGERRQVRGERGQMRGGCEVCSGRKTSGEMISP